MSGNQIGQMLRLTTFGESHGPAIGGVVDGFPAGVSIDMGRVQRAMDRRRPGQSDLTTERSESDRVEIISGVFEGITTGAPIAFLIPNKDHKSGDYDALRDVFRPSHADYAWTAKYGRRDHRGGGRSSARETACRVAGGALAAHLMPTVMVQAFVRCVGPVCTAKHYSELDLDKIDDSPVRCPDPATAAEMQQYIRQLKEEGDTAGGIVECLVRGVPAGWGEPVFDKLHAALGRAMLSINAVKGFEYGSGFEGTRARGSEMNDAFTGIGKTATNHSGGIQGGISNGQDIYFRVAFKPIASIAQKQQTVNTSGEAVELEIKGRHDPTVLPRAVPIVEAMTQLVLGDFALRAMSDKIGTE